MLKNQVSRVSCNTVDMIENNFLNYLFVEIMKTYPDKYLISSIKLGNLLVITASGNNNSFKYEYSLL